MKKPVLSTICCSALLTLSIGAWANTTATFEDVALGFGVNGSTIVSGGLRFVQGGDFGGVAEAADFDLFGNAPTGNTSKYYGAFNDSSVTMTAADGNPFRLLGFSFAFFATAGSYQPGDAAGALVVTAQSTSGALHSSFFSFGGADAEGKFGFRTLGTSQLGLLATTDVSRVTFSACTYSGTSCVSPSDNLNQFALDNVTAVPEPAALALMLMGLGVVGAAKRRRAA
ncbi:MAG TPA: NF038120 family PEP-CTERM protein [Rubrivivax sp.]|nr:NF038120 family PEP-CTERM protein [Rubrivivax sp.]